MEVLKFGGTSVASAENISKVVKILGERAGTPIIVVVSALGGITDRLLDAALLAAKADRSFESRILEIRTRHIECIRQLLPPANWSKLEKIVASATDELVALCNGIFLLEELTMRSKDRISSYGEYLSSLIITEACMAGGLNAQWKDARELITTNSEHTNAEVDFHETNNKVRAFFANQDTVIVIIPGFIAADPQGITTTLGRGGSDYSAAILAAAIDAERLEIWTDVSGMMTADPRLTQNARIIPDISYEEAMELSHFGAKVIFPPTIQPVMNKSIPVWIKNTFSPGDPGTMIAAQNRLPPIKDHSENIVRGISSISNIHLLSLEGSGMIGIPGFSKRFFEVLSNERINVILITQSSSEHSISVAVEGMQANRAKLAADQAFANELSLGKLAPLRIETQLSIVALVGENMKNHTGVSGRMFSAMGRNGVNIRAIAQGSSERNISAVISTSDVKKAINVLHEEFFETSYKQVNIFLTGTGNVGSRLLAQVSKQWQFLQEQLHLQLRVTGISNSRHMLIDAEGIDLQDWTALLEASPKADLEAYVDQVISSNLRNTVYVDITASDRAAAVYEKLLKRSISVVACNKVAASSEYSRYVELKELSREYNAHYLFETNVGAGLPVIGTLNDLVRSGDRIRRIEAVLSGTLNFVFNNYDGTMKFSDVVKLAQDQGYTEPDPRLDLGGTDVMRKILILAREAGEPMEIEQVVNNSFMPANCMQGSVEHFYEQMAKEEAHFQNLYRKAHSNGKKLKFVATYEDGRASVGLQEIPPGHDLYHLYGKDNVVLFYTDRYKEQPLVIKGAGAGADVTASGVFADIIRVAKA